MGKNSKKRANDVFGIANTNDLKDFPQSLAFQLWNIAVAGTPMDTGNARANTKLLVSNEKTIAIGWDTFNANYVDFLERGVGPVKKYKGFISVGVFGSFIQAITEWAYFGKVMGSWSTPVVFTSVSKSPFVAERGILRKVGFSTRKINAIQRERISQIRQMYGLNIDRGQLASRTGVPTMESYGRSPTMILSGSRETSAPTPNQRQQQRLSGK